MHLPNWTRATALAAALGISFASVPAIWAEEVPQWPSEQEQALKKADNQLLELQRARFRAIFAKDKEATKRLNKEFKELQKDRNQLLQATGRR